MVIVARVNTKETLKLTEINYLWVIWRQRLQGRISINIFPVTVYSTEGILLPQ